MSESWDNETWEDKINEFARLLTKGEVPEGVEIGRLPKLSKKAAESVIWFLQEITGIIPDHFEMCKECGDWFDYRNSGCHIEGKKGGFYCEGHLPLI